MSHLTKMLLKYSIMTALDTHTHTSFKTEEAITKLGWTLVPHPPYSQVLASSDFHLIGDLKDAICWKRFGSDGEVIEEVKYKIQTGTSRGQILLFLAGTRLLKLMEIM
jgi:hypothetical protein